MFRGVSVRLCVGQRAGQALASVGCCAVALLCTSGATAAPTIAFYYGPHPPLRALRAFDRAVLEPEHASTDDLSALAEAGVEVYARLRVGTARMDPAQPGWRQLLFEEARAIYARGYAGLYLDDLDRYQPLLRTEAERARRAQALLSWLADVNRELPRCKLILHGGLDLYPQVRRFVSGQVVGPLFARWDVAAGSVDVPAGERQQLLDRLAALPGRGDLPITVLDHVAWADRQRARAVAAQIARLGYEPWVAGPELDRLGVGSVESVPRRALVIYDSAEAPLSNSAAHRLAALPLEYFGLAVDYLDASGPLPAGRLEEQYVGIVSVLTDDTLPDPTAYRAWLTRQLDAGLRVAMLGRPGIALDAPLLQRLGLQQAGGGAISGQVQITRRDDSVGFEAEPVAAARELLPLRIRPGAVGMEVHLELMDAEGTRLHPVLTAPWGGLALEPFVIEPGLDGRTRWILEPFLFLARALAPPPIPILDVTTENGRRIFTSHIDGDGFVNVSEMPHRKHAGEVILEDILRRYQVPTTVSVIEAEVGATGLYREQSPKLEGIARQIFKLPHVEAASHAYSHPFDWDAAEHHRRAADHAAAHMPVPNYVFDLEREIAGSVAYIDKRLLPAGKQTRIFLWSGSAQPSAKAVAITRRLGLFNVNGASVGMNAPGVTSLSHVTCLGQPMAGGSYQVYAPHPNENNFTNLWHGPFYGYKRAIDVFIHTDRPRRLKPISLYYHFYSGSKPAGLSALRTVYDWSLEQEIIPLPLSDYAQKVNDFDRATLARTLDGGWEVRRLQSLRTVRFDDRLGWPDLAASADVTSVRAIAQGRYASFVPGERVHIRFRPEPPSVPHLVWANGVVTAQQRRGGELTLRLSGHVPLRALVAGCASGPPRVSAPKVQVTIQGAGAELGFVGKESGDVVLSCP
jgi:hypothetical protein